MEYSFKELTTMNLKQIFTEQSDFKVFAREDKFYFFEVNGNHYRLYDVITRDSLIEKVISFD